MRDLRTELRQHKGFAPSWQPEPGDIIVGTIVGFSIGSGQYGDVNIATIHDEEINQDLAVWLSSKVLLNEFQRLEPKIGERIGIRYDGKHPDKGYHRYIVQIDRKDEVLRERGGETSPNETPPSAGSLPLKTPPKKSLADDPDEIPF